LTTLSILDLTRPKAVTEEVERDIRILRIAFFVFTINNPGFDGMQFQMAIRQTRLKISLKGFGF
jgi:hypothetical protein